MWLTEQGWPLPIVADSGNGGHLNYLIDLPPKDSELLHKCLHAMAAKFDDGRVTIDQSVFNPARIWKLYGTWSCKGDDTPERPHRLARILSAPHELTVVSQGMLEALAGMGPTKPSGPSNSTHAGNGKFDIESWLKEHGLNVSEPKPWQDGRKWVFKVCPWNPAHTNHSAFLIQHSSGALSAGCHHNGCKDFGWQELRNLVEGDKRPGAFVSSVSTGFAKNDINWQPPRPLPSGLSVVMVFESNLLPEALRPWIEDIAERLQCPVDFPAVAAMVGLAGVVGRKVGIRPKCHDDWLVVPNLWGAVIGRPGVMKTPAIQEPFRPIRYLEKNAQQHSLDLKDMEVDEIIRRSASKEANEKIRGALERGNEQEAREWAAKLVKGDKSTSNRRRYIVNDSTVEKLGIILNENPNGITVYRDELIGLLQSLDKEGQEGARAFYLEAWNGTGRYTYDRVQRGTLDIAAAIVSVIGGIQPGPLTQYLTSATRHGAGDDGLMQRFQLAVWPDVSTEWKNVDRFPDDVARTMAHDVFFRLDGLNPSEIGATADGDEADGIPYLRFSPEAQDAFDNWRGTLERKIRSGDEHAAIESHLAKYRSLIPSLALLTHLADGNVGPIGLECVLRSIAWGAYLESHARRIYSVTINPDAASAKPLAQKLRDGEITDGFAIRDVYRHGWTGLITREEVLGAINVLVDLHWVHEEREATAGAPKTSYRINPKIYEMPMVGTDKTDKSHP
jgi:putative DNA primase/helicase